MTPICPYDKFQNRSRVKQCLLDTTGPLRSGTHTSVISVTNLQKIKPSIFYHGRGEAHELLPLGLKLYWKLMTLGGGKASCL